LNLPNSLGRVLETFLLTIIERRAEHTTNAMTSHNTRKTQKDIILDTIQPTDARRKSNDTVGVTQDIFGNVSRSCKRELR
jgi:hypothetical protein